MKASEVLREARNVLFERGWYQGYYYSFADDSVCLRGAVSVAHCGRVMGALYESPAIRVLERIIPERNVAAWNDAPERTFDEVIDILDRAEKQALIAEESA